jgi:hypothetical protein
MDEKLLPSFPEVDLDFSIPPHRPVTRQDVVRVARSYIGTPFHHRGRAPGSILDCAGIPVCVARELGLVAPDFDVPPYLSIPSGNSLIEWCNKYMLPIPQAAMGFGDVIVITVDKDPQHICVLADYVHGGFSIIHASNSRSVVPARVIETRLMFARAMHFVAAYRIPGVL